MNSLPCVHCTPQAHSQELVSHCVECGSATVAGFGTSISTILLAVTVCVGIVAFRRLRIRADGATMSTKVTKIAATP